MSFDNAFIGYNNYFMAPTASTLTVSNLLMLADINSLKNWLDYVQFASGTNYVQIDCGSAVNIDFLVFALMNYSLKTVLSSQLKAPLMWLLAALFHTLATLTSDECEFFYCL